MAYFREHWKPKKVQCSSPGALSGIVDRNGMGNLGKLPTELIIEVFKYIPFRQRLKTTLLVSKSFQGLVHEGSLWKTVEVVDRVIMGPTLAYMIQPSPLSGCSSIESLIPKGNVKELSIDMSYCTIGSVIEIIKRLQLQKHALTSLSMIGAWPILNSIIIHLCKQTRKNQISLSQITNFSLTGSHESSFYLSTVGVGALLASMPNLLHVRIEGRQSRGIPHLKVDESVFKQLSNPLVNTNLTSDACQEGHSRLKTLVIPFWVTSLLVMIQLGSFFPELEVLELGMTTSCENKDMNTFSPLPMLQSAKITYHADSKNVHSGASEEQISKYFIGLIANAPRLRELSFSDESHVSSKKNLDLFKCATDLCQEDSGEVKSLHLQNVTLKGWALIGSRCIERIEKFWRCPNLLDAPWLWVDVERRQRQRSRKFIRRNRDLPRKLFA